MRRYPDVTLSIIAGGKGRRLGGVAKGLLRLDGRSVLERQLELAPMFADVVLVTPDPAPYAAHGLRSIPDVIPERGAPGGVHAALVAARTPWVLALACDMPFVTGPVIAALLDGRGAAVDAVCFEAGGRLEPLLAAYRTHLADGWGRALAGGPSFRELLRSVRTRVLGEEVLRQVDPDMLAVRSLNLPEDLVRHGVGLPPAT